MAKKTNRGGPRKGDKCKSKGCRYTLTSAEAKKGPLCDSCYYSGAKRKPKGGGRR